MIRQFHRPSDFLRDGRIKLFGQRHQIVVIGIGHVKFQHREFWVVPRGNPFVAEVAIDFEDALESAHNQAFQVQFRRDPQIKFHVQRVVMRLERFRRRAARNRLHHRRFHFEKIPRKEKLPDRADCFGAFDENLFDVRIDNQIHVTLAIARFHVFQAVPFFRQRAQRFREQRQLRHENRQLLRICAEDAPGHADKIANIQRFIKFEPLFPQFFETGVNLNALRAAVNMSERRFALNSHGHHAPGGRHDVFRLFQFFFRFFAERVEQFFHAGSHVKTVDIRWDLLRAQFR